jgi:hypothetical protein
MARTLSATAAACDSIPSPVSTPASPAHKAEAEISALFPAILNATLPPVMRHIPQIERACLEVRTASTGWSRLRSHYTEPLLLLQLMVAAVLLICCANLSGLRPPAGVRDSGSLGSKPAAPHAAAFR